MIAVSTSVNTKKDHIFTRSASVPETMDAAVATNTIWKNQSDIVEYTVSAASLALNRATLAAVFASSGASSNAISSDEGP